VRVLAVLVGLLFLISCKSNSNKLVVDEPADLVLSVAKQYFDAVFTNREKGEIRGFSFGQTQEEIESIENELLDLVESNDQLSFYELILSNDTTKHIDYAEIKYFYDSKKELDVATINYYIEDSTYNILLFDVISTSYEKRHGHSYTDVDGYTVWTSDKESNSGFDIAMKMKKLLNLNEPGITIEFTKF
jgi:hypothetical protein